MAETPDNTMAGPAPWLRLLRRREWIKNSFVLAPLVFAGALDDILSERLALLAFALESSADTVLTDVQLILTVLVWLALCITLAGGVSL